MQGVPEGLAGSQLLWVWEVTGEGRAAGAPRCVEVGPESGPYRVLYGEGGCSG